MLVPSFCAASCASNSEPSRAGTTWPIPKSGPGLFAHILSQFRWVGAKVSQASHQAISQNKGVMHMQQLSWCWQLLWQARQAGASTGTWPFAAKACSYWASGSSICAVMGIMLSGKATEGCAGPHRGATRAICLHGGPSAGSKLGQCLEQ